MKRLERFDFFLMLGLLGFLFFHWCWALTDFEHKTIAMKRKWEQENWDHRRALKTIENLEKELSVLREESEERTITLWAPPDKYTNCPTTLHEALPGSIAIRRKDKAIFYRTQDSAVCLTDPKKSLDRLTITEEPLASSPVVVYPRGTRLFLKLE